MPRDIEISLVIKNKEDKHMSFKFDGLEPNEKKDSGSNAENHKELEESWSEFRSYTKKKKKKKKTKQLKKKNKKLKKRCKSYRKQKKQLQGENSVMQNNHTYLE